MSECSFKVMNCLRGQVLYSKKMPKAGVGSWIQKDEDRSQEAGGPLGQQVGGKEEKEKNSWYRLAKETLPLEMPEESKLLLRER